MDKLTANITIRGMFYRGMDKPILFSVEVSDHPEISYAEVPDFDLISRKTAASMNLPLIDYIFLWNDMAIECDRIRQEELERKGLGFSFQATSTSPETYRFFKTMNEDFLRDIGAEEMIDYTPSDYAQSIRLSLIK